MRADLLEESIIKDIRAMLRDEDFMARLWAKANELLIAEKPALEKELDRYFEAFEAGTMKPDLCNQKVKDLTATLEALEVERGELAARKGRLTIPPVGKERLEKVLSEFDETMANGTNPQKKHLLRRLVKKVLIRCRQTIEIWYALPNSRRFADCNFWLPECNSMRTRPGWVEPEIYFRIVHLAQVAQSGARANTYSEQTVEIALGTKGAFENGNIGALTRRAPPDQMLSFVLPGRGDPKPPREPKTPRVVELLRKAIKWKNLLESGKIASQAEIARQEGITRARVTQIMGMLRLAPEIQERILSLPDTSNRPPVTERTLRPIRTIVNPYEQFQEFQEIFI